MLDYSVLKDKTVLIKQVKSKIGSSKCQVDTLHCIGLRKIGDIVQLKCDKCVFGMLLKVVHLIDVKIKEGSNEN